MKYFLFNHEGSCNHGCEAIVRSTQKIIEKYDKDCSFILSSRNPQTDSGFDKTKVVKFQTRELKFFEKIIAKINLKLFKSEDYAIKKMYSPVVRQAESADICLSVGGDTYCYGDNYPLQILTTELKRKGKKIVLWGASVGEEDLDERKLKNLEIFDLIFAREPITFQLLKSKLKNPEIYLNFDPAFCLDTQCVEPVKNFKKENTIGINISPLVEYYNKKLSIAFDRFILYLINETNYNILLVPHVIENGNDDYECMLKYYRKYCDTDRIAILPNNLNAMQYKGYIADTRFFVGARTHATIAGYSSKVPTLALGYSVKSRGISKMIFGEEKYILNVKNISDVDEIINAFNELVCNEDEIKQQLGELKTDCFELGEILVKQAVK